MSNAVLEAIHAERQAVRERAEKVIRTAEAEREDALGKLDRAAAALGEGAAAAPPRKPKAEAKAKSLGRKKPPIDNSPAAAERRRKAIYEYLVQQGGPVSPGAIRRDLNMSENQVRAAGVKLIEEGRMRRSGERNRTTYEAIAKDGTTPPPTKQGTPQGRVMAALQESEGGATLAELEQWLVDMTTDEIRQVCGQLIREEEVRMDRRGNDPIYVLA